jgi:hypothetical protein
MQDERYAKYVGRLAIVPLTFGRHVPIIADRVRIKVIYGILYSSSNSRKDLVKLIKIK